MGRALQLALLDVPALARGGGAAALSYEQTLLTTYGASEVWPLVDIESGTTIPALSNTARNGTLAGWDLQNAAGPDTADSRKAPYSDGTASDYGNLFTDSGSVGLKQIFNPNEFSFMIWGKLNEPWTAAGSGRLFWLGVNSTNRIMLYKNGNFGYAQLFSSYGGTNKSINGSSLVGNDNWICYAGTISKTNDQLRLFFNAVEQGVPQTGLGTWSGDLVTASVLNDLTASANCWKGWGAFFAVKFGAPVWTPEQILAMYNAANPT